MSNPAKIASQLTKWEKNPRKITDEKKQMLAQNLDVYGDLGGVVFNVRNQRLVSGHQRSDAMAEGEITILKRYAEPTESGTVAIGHITHNGEQFAYREVDWDEDKHTGGALAANKSAGEWDYSILQENIAQLDTGAFDMSQTGFSDSELEKIMAPVRGLDTSGDAAMPSLAAGEKTTLCTMSFVITDEQRNSLQRALDLSIKMGEFIQTGNVNENGNAIARMAELFLGKFEAEYADDEEEEFDS